MASKVRVVTLMPIKDMDRAIRFYTDKLGAKMGERGQGDMKDDWASVSVGDHDFWLITPSKREKRSLAYTTFLVQNIKSYVTTLSDRGVKFDKAERMSPQTVVDGPIATESWGSSAFFKDSEGNVLMAWQNNPAM